MKLLLQLLGFYSMLATASAKTNHDTVVLLHGMGRSSRSMARIATALQREGYEVVNVSYPSRTKSLEALATEWLPARLAQIPAGTRVHFVTHSMGAIVLRLWLRDCGAPANLGRVVMLAPPNAGSEWVDRFAGFPPFHWITGCNGRRLGTAADSLPRQLGRWPAAAADLGIIAGASANRPLRSGIIPRPHDGKVSVAATHLAGERDHLVLRCSHTWLGWRHAAIAQVQAFLRDGQFARSASAPA